METENEKAPRRKEEKGKRYNFNKMKSMATDAKEIV